MDKTIFYIGIFLLSLSLFLAVLSVFTKPIEEILVSWILLIIFGFMFVVFGVNEDDKI